MDAPNFPKPDEFANDKRVQLVEETGHYIFTDPEDGTEYEYDDEKGAWFPMWNESLVEQQQSVYGTEPLPENDTAGRSAKRKSQAQSKKRENTSIYISGLPLNTTEEEVAEFFSQCGTIMPDILTNEPKVKLYRDGTGALKGDALVTYYKKPSVQLALDILDDSRFRPADPAHIRVQQAEFESKLPLNDADKAKRPRVDSKLVQKRLNQLEKKLDWFEGADDIAERHKRTVILKHMFTFEELEADVTLLLDLPEDVRSECEKLGKVTSVKVYDKSDEGVVAVKFKDELSARACVKMMNGRFFAGRQVEASIYDGHTRYKATKRDSETAATANVQGSNGNALNGDEDEDEQRMEQYAQWLDSGS
ncbi:hypothetical protein IWW36_002149 [Coemansia brasiliensis]|uniref:RRM domain-containing protein n=1 Tax=Coemansia brasiliensis TaxID=2650707 RepID=A0A9W8IA93_9FUNG|nr:hypothetical protein IWW36_002149 [Coemansia brasiliensis]